MLLLQLEFRSIFDGDDAFVGGDEPGQHVEKGGLAGAGTAGHYDVQLCIGAGFHQLDRLGGDRAAFDQALGGQHALEELSDRDRGSFERERRDNHVHT